ncbi:JmjC domain-containing protein [Planctomicrobium piriforme]|uniref:Cupin-like domain-containing protein n=1 Tax=Planctomicrobium piriforme TaxID=1576369 RepID=A0A1I3SRZ2_9PLAN|nr:cupin domain-containing protein [Planctomicrobium piriforme]SFJ60992.1 Cupin-like domain-containing protein [Planctomicrobium piriforme]
MTTLTAAAPIAASQPVADTGSLLQIHPVEFEQNFSQRPFLIGHRLSTHPLFQIERLLELSQRLPESCIEYNAGNIPVSIDSALTPRNGLTPEETIRRIAECKSWMVLKYVERDPQYSQLLEECLTEIRPYSEPITPGMMHPQAFIFVTSPGSVTPYHIDPEHNFLLQIRGSKEVRMLDGRDRGIVSEIDLENFYSDRGRNLRLNPEHEQAGWTYHLQPGQGLHFPVTYPHWVKNGNEVSISFSITFRTPDLDRRRSLYQSNAEIRARGGNPWPVGKSRLRDSLIYTSSRIRRKLASLLSKPEQHACGGRKSCGT